MFEKTAWSFSADRGPTQEAADEPSHIHIPRPSRVVSRIERIGASEDVRIASMRPDRAAVEADDPLDEIDAAYWAKYGRRYPGIVPRIVNAQARAATRRLIPR